MCGINGILRLSERAPAIDPAVLVATCDAMSLRGPDGAGAWYAEDGTVGLGHRRLAIIDLSDGGRQPMTYGGGRFHLVFNGEIYNYRELRSELEHQGVRFVSQSDTEVVLALFEREGEAMLPKLRGMFAFAIWDAVRRRLVLARDPYGIKPLYVCEDGGWLQFASQVKALEAGGHVPRAHDPAAVAGFLLWGSIPEPRTFRRAIRALPAGHVLVVEAGRVGEPRRYRDLRRLDVRSSTGIAEALESTVRAHLVADVPVAVFLSAGIDSSLIAALARRETDGELTTLTARFEDLVGTPADEGPIARALAERLGTRHIETMLSREDLRGLWPKVIAAMDQPSVDGFNTYVVSRVAHDAGFKVVLSGLGGDELFGGYSGFHEVPAIARRVAALSRAPGVATIWPPIARALAGSRPKLAGLFRYGGSLPGAYYLRRALYLPEELPAILGREVAAEAMGEADPVKEAISACAGSDGDGWLAVHLLESGLYMKNQLLRDSDWASMAHSLELRVPFVDARLRDEIAGLGFAPARTGGKAAVARASGCDLPASIVDRPKTGFSIPVIRAIEAEDPGAVRGGLGSRRIARRVLESFGVPLAPPSGEVSV